MAVHTWDRGERRGRHWATAAIAAAAVLAPLTTTALAQSSPGGRLLIAPSVGIAVPAGGLGEYVNTGPAAGLRIGYELGSGVSLIADGGIDFLKGTNLTPGIANPIRTPEMRMQRYIAGVEAKLGTDAAAPWSLLASLGAGASRLDTDEYRTMSGSTEKFDQTAFTAAGGIELGYALTRRLELVADGRLYWSFLDKDRTRQLEAIRPAMLDPIDTAVTLPLVLALRTRV